MKQLKQYLEELFTTPANTIGMGGIISPGNDTNGSGDLILPVCITGKSYKLKRKKNKTRKPKK